MRKTLSKKLILFVATSVLFGCKEQVLTRELSIAHPANVNEKTAAPAGGNAAATEGSDKRLPTANPNVSANVPVSGPGLGSRSDGLPGLSGGGGKAKGPRCTSESDFVKGIEISLNGENYHFHGPLDKREGKITYENYPNIHDTFRDIPGHAWCQIDEYRLIGRHYNSGPFGIPSFWSSDAPDGALLYHVEAVIRDWSIETANELSAQGFVHYHELTRHDRTPHPTKVAFLKHHAMRSFTLDGGPRPWQSHSVVANTVDTQFINNTKIPYFPREKYLYSLSIDKGGADPDFLATICVNPEANLSGPACTLGQIVSRVDMPNIGDELHHFGYNVFQDQFLIPGLFSGRLHLVDMIPGNFANPVLSSFTSNLTPLSNYIVPHTVLGVPKIFSDHVNDRGFLVSTIGSNTMTTAPGGIVQVNSAGTFIAPFGPSSNRTPANAPPRYMYDIGINVLRNRMISTSFGLPGDIAAKISPAGLGDEVYVWDFKTRKVLQTFTTSPNTGALEVRWLMDPGVTIGFTNMPGTNEILRWQDPDVDGVYDFQIATNVNTDLQAYCMAKPCPSGIDQSLPVIPTDMLLSADDRYMYVSGWGNNSLLRYNITDPYNVVLESVVAVPYSQMLRLSPDNERLYVTNSLLSTWDDDGVTLGAARNTEYGVFLVQTNHAAGLPMSPAQKITDYMNVQKKNTIGPARPHQGFFDPNIVHDFGSH